MTSFCCFSGLAVLERVKVETVASGGFLFVPSEVGKMVTDS